MKKTIKVVPTKFSQRSFLICFTSLCAIFLTYTYFHYHIAEPATINLLTSVPSESVELKLNGFIQKDLSSDQNNKYYFIDDNSNVYKLELNDLDGLLNNKLHIKGKIKYTGLDSNLIRTLDIESVEVL